jgi:hypothetical protein
MTHEEFTSWLKSSNAIILPRAADSDLIRAQATLQQMQAAMIPAILAEFYKNTGGGLILGDAHIFGLAEVARGNSSIYHIPSLLDINRDMSGFSGMRGRTLFGRNGMFWFCFDAFGNCFMLNNMTLQPMRKYDDIYKAMTDCLAVGKI